jgi:GTP cyclohydrolase IA
MNSILIFLEMMKKMCGVQDVSITLKYKLSTWELRPTFRLHPILSMRGISVAIDEHNLEVTARNLLYEIGEDPERSGLKDTPRRVAKSLMELTSGYREDIESEIRTFDAEGADQMVCQWNIPLYSLCEHHILPFVGYAHIGYIPKGRVAGLSKLKRVVDHFARRLQIQERLTREVCDYLEGSLSPRGVIVVVEAEHMCMTMRGVQAPGTRTTTSAVTGDFRDETQGSRDEFFALMAMAKRGE